MRSFKKILTSVVVGLLFGWGTLSYVESQPKVSKYEIFEKNYGDMFFDWLYDVKHKKYHAIIQISDPKDGGTCTAFVISDTAALTAGHCMKLTKQALEDNKEKGLKIADKNIEKVEIDLIILEETCLIFDPTCAIRIDQLQKMLDTMIEAREILEKQEADKFKVYDVNGNDTGIIVKAYSKNSRRDYGWLQGDFRDFDKLPMRSGWHVEIGDTLRVCGFYGSKLPPSCTNFVALGNYGFEYAGEGILQPGVSGGPVIDHLGYVVGIASAAHDDFIVITPTLGVVDFLTKEQAEKKKDGQ